MHRMWWQTLVDEPWMPQVGLVVQCDAVALVALVVQCDAVALVGLVMQWPL